MDRRPVLRTLLKLVLFACPVALLFAYPSWVLWRSGEFMTPEAILRAQEEPGPETIIVLAHSESWGYLKTQAVTRRQPEIITLGSSRVLPFRASFFSRPFYNAGSGARTIDQFREFLERIPEASTPRWILIGLDHNFFNAKWDPDEINNFRKPGDRDWLLILVERWHRVYTDRLKRKFTERKILSPPQDGIRRAGLTALVRSEGYFKDGAYRWNVPENKKFGEDLNNIRKNHRWYVRGAGVSPRAVKALEEFLALCDQREVRVAAILPPYSPTIYQRLLGEKNEYAHVFETAEKIRPLFETRGMPFMDFTDPSSLSAVDADFEDGQHLKAGGAVSLLRHFAQAFPELSPLLAGDSIAKS